jgi:exosome complex component RRP41
MQTEYERPDGRKPTEMRELKIEVGILDRADGSAKVYLGKNMAIASVYGPRELHPKHFAKANRAVVRLNYRMATFSVDDYKRPFPSRREKEISKVLSEAFESVVLTKLFPRSVIDVHVQLFQSDGGTRTAAAIAASAALADAGIPMRDITGGIASGIYEDHPVLDMTGHEDMKGSGDMPILYSPVIDEVSLFQLDGHFTFEQFKESFNYSLDAIKDISQKIQGALKDKYLIIRDEVGIDDVVEEEIDVEEKLAEEVVKEIVQEEKMQESKTQKIEDPQEQKPLPPITSHIETQAMPSETASLEKPDPGVGEVSSESKEESSPELLQEKGTTAEPQAITSWNEGTSTLAPTRPDPDAADVDTKSADQASQETEKPDQTKKDEENDVLRDIEYTDFEEDS